MRHLLIAAAVLVAAAVPSTAAAAPLCGLDRHYLTADVQGNLFEIAGGRIAEQRGTTGAVKNLGAVLARDHSKALTQSGRLARKLGLKVPGNPSVLQHWQLHYAQAASGLQFDQAYSWLEVADHTLDLEDAREEAQRGCNPAVRALARSSIPMLKLHLKLATQAQTAAKSG